MELGRRRFRLIPPSFAFSNPQKPKSSETRLFRHSLPFDMVSCPHWQEGVEGLVSKCACLNVPFILVVGLGYEKKRSSLFRAGHLEIAFALALAWKCLQGPWNRRAPQNVTQNKHGVWEAPSRTEKDRSLRTETNTLPKPMLNSPGNGHTFPSPC